MTPLIVYSSQYIFTMCSYSIPGGLALWFYVLTLFQSRTFQLNAKQIVFPVTVLLFLILIIIIGILLNSYLFESSYILFLVVCWSFV